MIQVLFSADEIDIRVDLLADEIIRDGVNSDQPLLLVPILKGAFMFAADLTRALTRKGVEVEIDFLKLASYGDGTETSGHVDLLLDVSIDVSGRDVLVLDDILDTGHTLAFVKDLLTKRDAARVRTCVLLDKLARRELEISSDFCGFECPDAFVVGYGMDLAGKGRGLPYIGTGTPDLAT